MIDYTAILELKYKNCLWGLNANDPNQLSWSESNTIPKPTKEELDSQWDEVLSIRKKQDCKNQAKALLASSDWAELPSSIELLENANEWKAYRVEVKKLLISPVEAPSFPNVPEVRWK